MSSILEKSACMTPLALVSDQCSYRYLSFSVDPAPFLPLVSEDWLQIEAINVWVTTQFGGKFYNICPSSVWTGKTCGAQPTCKNMCPCYFQNSSWIIFELVYPYAVTFLWTNQKKLCLLRIQDDFRDPVFSLIEDWDSEFYRRTTIFAILTWDRRQNYKEEEGWDTMGFGIWRG